MNASIKTVLSVFIVIITWGQTMADIDPTNADSCARYELLTDHIYDFGNVNINTDSISTEFLVRSTGNIPIIILEGSASCPCTSVMCSSDIVSPGDTLMVKLTYHPYTLGAFKQSAIVKTNTKPYSHFWLYVMGNVVESKPKDDLQDGDD